MPRMIGRIGDRLLGRLVPRTTAAAENCYYAGAWCVHPSNACKCSACQMKCWDCAGYRTCSMTGACC